jgi:glutamyl-tRNA(Gln) amidotransferase subunit E
VNYKELGLKVGLEIHQQLDTHKLFCNCPSIIRDDEPDFKIKRVLFPSPGETGEIDKAALEERKKGKYFIYEGYNDTTCLVEIDEEPPKDINKEALKIALTVAKLLNMDIFDEIHVMRKIVVDGSNTSGFQRTALIAENGYIELTNGKKVGIETLCLEEDSARKIEEHNDYIVYRLDRLGIPLVEIATKPDLNEPEEVKEAAYKIGRLLRATKVKRGLGTIRQDINVSIKDGNRVEIKGAQDLDLIPEIVKNEVERQLDLLKLRDELLKRFNILSEEEKEKIKNKQLDEKEEKEIFEKILNWLKENTKIIYLNEDEDLKIIPKEAESKILRNKEIKAISFPKDFKGIFGFKINKYRFGTELAKRISIFGFRGLIHSDEDLSKYKLSEEEIQLLKEKLGAFILIAYTPEEKNKVSKAIDAILERIALAFIGVPKETRKANEDGTTSFLRPMPGKSRMYPETDLPLYKTKDLIPKELPETLEQKEERLAKILGKELAKQIVDHYKLALFEKLLNKYNRVNPKTLAYLFLNLEKELRRELKREMKEFEYEILAKLLNEGLVVKESLFDIMKNVRFEEGESLDSIKEKLKGKDLLKLDEETLRKRIKEKIEELKKKGLNEKAIRGSIIKEFRIKAEVPLIMKILNELLK